MTVSYSLYVPIFKSENLFHEINPTIEAFGYLYPKVTIITSYLIKKEVAFFGIIQFRYFFVVFNINVKTKILAENILMKTGKYFADFD